MANSVVLPAPFGPISPVMRPAAAANDTWSSATRPPKRRETPSTRSKVSAMGAIRRRRGGRGSARPKGAAQVGDEANDPARCERHHQDEHAAVDDEIEPGGIAG